MRLLIVLLAACAAYLLLWPVDIHPQAWTPIEAPKASGVLAPNEKLRAAKRWAVEIGAGGEAVAIDSRGHLYTGMLDGRVMRIDRLRGQSEELVSTGGRPLGMAFAPDGRLLIADAFMGLLVWDGRSLNTLLTEVEGVPLRFADDLAITRDGVVYLSDASTRRGLDELMGELMEHAPNGRLIRFDLATGEALVALDNLWFANGVTLSQAEDYVLINETFRFQIRRLWIKGPRRGQNDVFAQNLPGFPDNITTAMDGSYWVAIYGPRSQQLESLLPHPWMRKVIWRLPRSLIPHPERMAQVLKLDVNGDVVMSLAGSGDAVFAPITSVIEYENELWLGSLADTGLARYTLKP